MSIIDGLPSTIEELQRAMNFAVPIVSNVLAKMNLTPRQRSIINLMNEGVPLADILEISKQQRDAIFLKGCQLFQFKEYERARDLLTVLYQLQPLDARVIYLLAAIFQVQGDVATAAKLLIYFLALDATNPDGYLRLGECFLAAKEFDKAASTFRAAVGLCENGRGSPQNLEHGRRMLAYLEERSVAPN